MNKKYICINDKVEVKNEFNEIKTIDYSDNIEEILIKENVIEQIEIEYKRLLNEKKHNKNISFKSLKRCIITLIIIPVVLIILPLVLGVINISNFSIFSCLLGISIPSFLGSFLIYEYNKINRENNGIDTSLIYLESKLNEERKNLQKLKQNKSNKIINVPVSRRVDDIEQLKRLRNNLLIYYNYGFYQNKHHNNLKEKVYKLNNVS